MPPHYYWYFSLAKGRPATDHRLFSVPSAICGEKNRKLNPGTRGKGSTITHEALRVHVRFFAKELSHYPATVGKALLQSRGRAIRILYQVYHKMPHLLCSCTLLVFAAKR